MNWNNYNTKRLVKGFLLSFAFLIGFFSLFYTNKLVKKLEVQERQKIENWANATRIVPTIEGTEITNFIVDLLQQNTTIPVILTDEEGNITGHRNLDSLKIDRPGFLDKRLKDMKSVTDPIVLEFYEGKFIYIYYENSSLLRQLKIYPYFQLGVIALFLIVSYFAFSYSRTSEQNKVWAGMSKETAHQLGTPISSLIAWVDYLHENEGQASERVLKEIKHDLNRLELITDRFSKIGSEPVLDVASLDKVLLDSVEYINSRTSDRVEIEVVNPEAMSGIEVLVNIPLFAWVIENLCKNAVDAMEGEGSIQFIMVPHAQKVIIDVTDTGKGLSSGQYKTIFRPGYTTKARGWGLGLSLVKRIIENYHRGKIYVKHSSIGEGTTFRIELMRA